MAIQNTKHTQQVERTDRQIVEQTEQLAAIFADRFFGSRLDAGRLYRNAKHPKAAVCWEAACIAQDMLTQTDVQNAIENYQNTGIQCGLLEKEV